MISVLNRKSWMSGLAAVALLAAGPATATHVKSSSPIAGQHGPRLVMPIMNPARGKKLFVAKGCVACHAINGVGGHDAPAMDAHGMKRLMNPFDFAAKMWNHAPSMIAAQEGAIGKQIYFTGEELADIIAFIHDDETQHEFTEDDLTPEAQKMMHHQHDGAPAHEHHAPAIGHHPHPPSTPPHKD